MHHPEDVLTSLSDPMGTFQIRIPNPNWMKTKEKVQIQLLPSDLLDPPNGGHNKPWKRSLKTANLGHLEEPGNWILWQNSTNPILSICPFV